MVQLSPCRNVKLPSTRQQASQCQYQCRLIGNITRANGQPSHRYGHHSQCKQPSQQRLTLQESILATLYLLHRAILFDDEVKANAVDGRLHLFRCEHGIVIFNKCHARRQVYTCRLHALEFAQSLFYMGRARRACHAHDGNSSLLNHDAKVVFI